MRKIIPFLFLAMMLGSLVVSCSRDEVIVEEPGISINQLLNSYDLWYVDINSTSGLGEVYFLQIAFTISFRNGVLYANNNLVGIGQTGNGYGIPIGNYDAYDMILDVDHDIDGFDTFDVYQINDNTIELYNPSTDTSYFLEGYDRSNFDYDFVFFDNIHYFLQEYEAWEKTYASEEGELNEFDNENYLQFFPDDFGDSFRSSTDVDVTDPNNIVWDYLGLYQVDPVPGDMYLKNLTLNYDNFGNENFELDVLNDATIELYHISSGTTYEFSGVGYIEFKRVSVSTEIDFNKKEQKLRRQYTPKKANPREPSRL